MIDRSFNILKLLPGIYILRIVISKIIIKQKAVLL